MLSQGQEGQNPFQPSPVARSEHSTLIQEKLSARQAQREAKAAERRKKSDALKEEGNALFRSGDFLDALSRYQEAVAVHGPSVHPPLLANLAAAYLKLGMYPEAHDAADRALAADPKSEKARYRRGVARKHMKMWTAAEIDFRMLLALDPGNKDAEAELACLAEKRRDPSFCEEEEGETDSYSEYEAPALDDDPHLGESQSESSDCEHTGNGVPCKFYNRSKCKNGRACRFSHAPDGKSERDALGRNVCRYYLIGVCKFGERCSYLHSKEYLLQNGWWSSAEGVNKERKRYNLIHMINKAVTDYNNSSETGQASKKKKAMGKQKQPHHSRPGLKGSQSEVATPYIGEAQRTNARGKKKEPALTSYVEWGIYGSDGEDEEGCMFGFTGSEVDELHCQGVKPWDDDAWDVLSALREW